MKTNRTEIVVETHRILTIKRGGRCRLASCEGCGKQVKMVTADEAAVVAGLSTRAIYQLLEERELHFVETPDGMVFICLDSLGGYMQNRR